MTTVQGGPDTRFMRRDLVDSDNGGWKRDVTPFEMSSVHYESSCEFNSYVESLDVDYRRATSDEVLDTKWEGAKECVYRWRVKLGVRCRLGMTRSPG